MMNLLSNPVTTGLEIVADLGVAFEVCEAFRTPIGNDEPFCASCGHLADDHERDDAAQVTRLGRLPAPRRAPARKAS
jgi:hypothetical protein